MELGVHQEAKPIRNCFITRSVGSRPSESAEGREPSHLGKEAEIGNSTERVGDAGRRSHSALVAGRSQDGVLKQFLRPAKTAACRIDSF